MQQGPHHVAHTVENSLVVFYTVHLCRLEGDVGMAIDAILNEKHERGLFFHNAEIGKLRLCHLGSKGSNIEGQHRDQVRSAQSGAQT